MMAILLVRVNMIKKSPSQNGGRAWISEAEECLHMCINFAGEFSLTVSFWV